MCSERPYAYLLAFVVTSLSAAACSAGDSGSGRSGNDSGGNGMAASTSGATGSTDGTTGASASTTASSSSTSSSATSSSTGSTGMATGLGTTSSGGETTGTSGGSGTTGGAGSTNGSAATGSDGGPGGSDGGSMASTGWTCPPGPFGNPIPAGATPAQIPGVPIADSFNNTGYNFTTVEGALWLGDSVYVSEFPGSPNPPPSRILKVTANGMVSVAIADSGTNGLAVDKKGVLYGAVHKDGSISRIDLSTGKATPIVSMYNGSRFNSPNDLTIRSDGNIYFSDPNYQAPNPTPQMKTRVYRIAPGTNEVTVVDESLQQPNGVTLSLDEKTLYVDSSAAPINQYPIKPDGSVGPGTMFSQEGSGGDGMTIDCAGNLYVAKGTTVIVLNSSGTKIGTLTVTGPQAVTNVAFGGSDHQTLYLTTQGSNRQQGLFQVKLAVPGMPY